MRSNRIGMLLLVLFAAAIVVAPATATARTLWRVESKKVKNPTGRGPDDYREQGTLNGVAYDLFQDRSGGFGKPGADYFDQWHTSCREDLMNDTRTCIGTKGDLSIVVRRSGVEAILVGSQHYPGTNVMLRIDDTPPLSADPTGWSDAEAIRIYDGLKKAQTVATRYSEWPYPGPKDKKVTAFGVAEMVEYLKFAVTDK